ncbi:MAG: metal ABC transporter ATP-binding protein [Clostridia bacterium]|nr:metal ABC transporter ATP-binding protein [Clostridia bacterium]
MAQLTCRDLCIGYENTPVVTGLTFDVEAGDYLAIVGENGAGKTTLMKTILGLVRPVSGEIRFSDGLKKTEIGYLPQQTMVQKDFPASVLEVVLSGFLASKGARPFYNRAERELARVNLERMGLDGFEKKSYRDLSGGQQQRVLLARALCATRKLILLDEPASGLDPKVTVELYELIRDLNRDGITVLMISHDIEAALTYANKILHIGREIFFGTTQDYRKSDTGKRFAGIGEVDHG